MHVQLTHILPIAIVTMSVFWRSRLSITLLDSNFYLGAIFFGMVTMLSSSIIELTLLMARLPIFFLQRDNLLFPAWAWSVPMALLSLPVSLWSAGRPSPTTASASPPNSPGKYSFISQLLLFFVTHMAGSALYRAVATVLRSTTVINTLGNFIIVLLFLLSGFIVTKADIHGVWEWVYWISSLTYCQNAFSANEFLAPRWDVLSDPPSLNTTLGLQVLTPRSLWTDAYWVWAGGLVGIAFTLFCNVVTILAFKYLNPWPRAQPVISQHQLDAREIALGSTNLECSSRSSSLCSLTLSRIGSTAIARFLATDRFHSPKSLARPSLSARSLTSLPSGSTKVHLRVMSEGGQGEAGGGELGRDVAESTAWHVLPFDPLTLSFHYVNYYVDMPAELKDKAARPGQRLQLLRNVSGVFRPGVLTALMGVSGYCEQVDIHTPQVTVHESLLYSAWLRLPEEIDRDVILHTIHPFKHTHPTKLPSLISALLSSLSHLRPPLFPLSSPHSSLPSLISALLSSLSHLHTPLFPLSSPHSSLPSLISALLSSLSISALLSSLSISALLSSLSISTLLSSLSISALLSSLSHICTPLFPLSSPHSSLPSLISALLSSLSHICTPLFPLHLRTPLFPLHLRTPLFPLSSLHSSLPSLISALLSSLSHLRTPLFPLSYPHSSLPSLISALLSSLSHLRTPLFPLHLRTPLFPLHLPCPISHLPSQSPLPTPHEIRGGGDGAGGASTEFVEEVEDLVELEPVKGALVGRAGQDGLSVEQRKRLTIAVELVANPAIIFMDEPTSAIAWHPRAGLKGSGQSDEGGLDARAAAIVMRAVRNTVNTGRTVVCTIHQLSIDIFEAFDELLLMQRGGEVIYAGSLGKQSCDLVRYFKAIPGVPPIQPGANPAAWMLEVTASASAERLRVDFAHLFLQSDLFRPFSNSSGLPLFSPLPCSLPCLLSLARVSPLPSSLPCALRSSLPCALLSLALFSPLRSSLPCPLLSLALFPPCRLLSLAPFCPS
ncbi:unnamed protein product, partial [Closterium sp. NIES-64]